MRQSCGSSAGWIPLHWRVMRVVTCVGRTLLSMQVGPNFCSHPVHPRWAALCI